MYHVKALIVDSLMVSVGSTNFDNRSFSLNDEANLNVLDPDFARAQVDVFDATGCARPHHLHARVANRPWTEKRRGEAGRAGRRAAVNTGRSNKCRKYRLTSWHITDTLGCSRSHMYPYPPNLPDRSRMKKTLLSLAILTSFAAQADEGMWMPQQLPQVAKQLKAAGLKLDPATLTKLTEFPMGAVVSLGGCSASFVSPQGLVVTNHHCVYNSVAVNSTPQRDLLANGFLAKTLAKKCRPRRAAACS
jgi:hypothetical protein